MAKRLQAEVATLCYDPKSGKLPLYDQLLHMPGSSTIEISFSASHRSQLFRVLTTEFELDAI